MNGIIRAKPFKVIHWEYSPRKYDKPTLFEVRESLKLIDTPHVIPKNPANRILQLSWRFRYFYLDDNTTMLSYIADDYFTINDYKNCTTDNINELLMQSYALFGLNFDEMKQGSDLQYSSFKPYESLGVDLDTILTHLKESAL
jgi:hypothetical protein